MTPTDLAKGQLATILAALDDRPRSPANRTEALKAIGKSAGRYGLSSDDVLAAAPGLLDGRLSPAEFRAELQELAGGESADSGGAAAVEAREPAPAPANQEPPEAGTAPEAAHAAQDGHDDEDAATGPETTEPAPAAAQAPTTGEAQTAAPVAEGKQRRAAREGTKRALLIGMLQRPEGATVDEVVAATGWQRHTVRGAISGALKKKLSLEVTSGKAEGRGRVYRIPG